MSPREVLTNHTSRELTEWMALFRLKEIERQQQQPPK